jgi:hypothetical protein
MVFIGILFVSVVPSYVVGGKDEAAKVSWLVLTGFAWNVVILIALCFFFSVLITVYQFFRYMIDDIYTYRSCCDFKDYFTRAVSYTRQLFHRVEDSHENCKNDWLEIQVISV